MRQSKRGRVKVRQRHPARLGGISLFAGRRIRRSECGRKSRPAPFEMRGGGRWGEGTIYRAPTQQDLIRRGRGEEKSRSSTARPALAFASGGKSQPLRSG